jgi:hypothetical protein
LADAKLEGSSHPTKSEKSLETHQLTQPGPTLIRGFVGWSFVPFFSCLVGFFGFTAGSASFFPAALAWTKQDQAASSSETA